MKIPFRDAVGCDVLLIAYGGGHVNMLIPMALLLQARGRKVVFLALTTARPVLENSPLPFITYADFPFQNEISMALGLELAGSLPPNPAVPVEDSLAYLGLNFLELQQRFGVEQARRLYEEQGRVSFEPLQVMVDLLRLLKPSVVVATNSPRSEKAAIFAAQQLSIPSVCVVDLFALREIEWIGRNGFASKVCVLNDAVKKLFTDFGRSADDLEVTGNPAFDALFKTANSHLAMGLLKERAWDDGLLNVLWASQPEPLIHPFDSSLRGDEQLPVQIELELRQAIQANKNLRLIVRHHPSECREFEPAERVFRSMSGEDINVLLHAVDVVITMTSTVGLQASLLGRQVLTVDSSIFFEDMPYSRMGMSLGFDSPKALARHVQLLKPESLKKAAVGATIESATLASPRVASVIERFL